MQLKKILSLSSLLLTFPILLFAGVNDTPDVDARQARQEKRIEQGLQSGSLTNAEAAKLEKGQDKVTAKEAEAKSDGIVTPAEHHQLRRLQRHQSHRIHHQKHDGQHL